MKAAVIGHGNTGQAVVELLEPESIHAIFNQSNSVTAHALSAADVAIIFIPKRGFEKIFGELLAAKIPVVCGTTGIDWDDGITQQIRHSAAPWIVANNFSFSMVLIKECLQILGQGRKIFPAADYHIHETHHVAKVDAPSGTAKSWQAWLGEAKASLSYTRAEDVKGEHCLTIKTAHEEITLRHQAHDRQLFAQGAVWAAQYLHSQNDLVSGVHYFSDIVKPALLQEGVLCSH